MFLVEDEGQVAFWQPGGHGHKAVDPIRSFEPPILYGAINHFVPETSKHKF